MTPDRVEEHLRLTLGRDLTGQEKDAMFVAAMQTYMPDGAGQKKMARAMYRAVLSIAVQISK